MSELNQLRALNDREAVAYWNICTMSGRMLLVGDHGRNARHLAHLTLILRERGISCSPGRLTVSA